MNPRDPWEVLIWAMELHVEEALCPEPQSVKDQKWMHVDAAGDFAKAALPWTKVKAEGAQIEDPTAELEVLKNIFLRMDSVDRESIKRYLRRLVGDGETTTS